MTIRFEWKVDMLASVKLFLITAASGNAKVGLEIAGRESRKERRGLCFAVKVVACAVGTK